MQIGQLILKNIRRVAACACVVGTIGFVTGLVQQEMDSIVIGAVFAVFGGGIAYFVSKRIVIPAVKPTV